MSSDEIPGARVSAVLKSSGLFDALAPVALQELSKTASSVRLGRGQIYQLMGSPVKGLVIVASGYLRVSLSNSDGKRHVVRHLGAGNIVDLLPVLDGGPAIHDAEAGTDTELVVVPKAVVLDLMRRNPAVCAAAQAILNARSRLLYNGLADAMLLTLRQRCARTLLDVAREFGEATGAGPAVTVRLSQSEFAEMLGNARPVVNRALMALQRDGVIELGYQRILVLRPDALRQAAGL